MWNLKRLPSNVLFKVKLVIEENVRMASKKAPDEKPKAPKRGFFRRSESVMPDNSSKNMSDSLNSDALSNESDSKKVIRRSSMICSEGFDKYTFDCHRRDIPTRSVGLELDAVAATEDAIHNRNQNQLVSENNAFVQSQSSKSVPVEQTPVRKISPFKPLSVLTAPVKNAPLPFKRVTEETVPGNIPMSYKRVPEETIPVTNTFTVNTADKSPVTTIPFSFNPVPEEANRIANASALKNSPVKSAPIKSSPFSFKNISDESGPVKNAPLSVKNISEKSRPVSKAFSFRSISNEPTPVKNAPLSFQHVPAESASNRSAHISDDPTPVRSAPLSFKHADEFPPTRPPRSARISDDPTPVRSAPLTFKNVPDEFTPTRSAPLSFKHVPQQTVSNNNVLDESIPVRSTPLSLKGESVSLRNIHSSLRRYSDQSSTPTRSIPLSLQPVPEEPVSFRESTTSLKYIPDEPIPFRNSPLSLKPITKHISLLRKKTPSFRSPIIKRDSVVHPGRIDMQGSLFIDGRFQNPWPTWKPPTFANILKFGVTRNKSKVPPKQELDLVLPIVKQNFSKLSIPDDGIRATWIGHSTVFIQMHGLNILTDPMFSDRASPSQVVGPKRYREPPCTIHDLPHINAVVISHSHYDHLDHNTITLLNARFGPELRWFVPLGLQSWMEQVGCENVVELDWWEENCVPEHSDTFFVFTPAQHWSKRVIGDDNKVLWGSWCILGPKYKFFFAGDTGYCEVFKQIGRVHGPFDLSAIPIGAYEPRWFMKYQHVNPEEAVKIHMDVRSKKSLAIHWGTFSLANEYYLDPPVKLRESLDKYEIPPEQFFTLKHGESRIIAQNNLSKKYPLNERNTNEY